MRSLMIAAALLLPLSAQAEEPLTLNIKTMTTDTAARIAQATLEECRGMGIPVGVTVMDRVGNPLVVMRDTNAPQLTLELSRKKAYTALSFNVPTSALGERGASPIATHDPLMFLAGGIPVEAGGSVLGSVGVSGAPSGLDDEKCALAGVQAVQMDLEME